MVGMLQSYCYMLVLLVVEINTANEAIYLF